MIKIVVKIKFSLYFSKNYFWCKSVNGKVLSDNYQQHVLDLEVLNYRGIYYCHGTDFPDTAAVLKPKISLIVIINNFAPISGQLTSRN